MIAFFNVLASVVLALAVLSEIGAAYLRKRGTIVPGGAHPLYWSMVIVAACWLLSRLV